MQKNQNDATNTFDQGSLNSSLDIPITEKTRWACPFCRSHFTVKGLKNHLATSCSKRESIIERNRETWLIVQETGNGTRKMVCEQCGSKIKAQRYFEHITKDCNAINHPVLSLLEVQNTYLMPQAVDINSQTLPRAKPITKAEKREAGKVRRAILDKIFEHVDQSSESSREQKAKKSGVVIAKTSRGKVSVSTKGLRQRASKFRTSKGAIRSLPGGLPGKSKRR